MFFDFRVFLGQSFDGTSQSVDDLLHSMDALHIEHALAFPLKPISYNLDAANTALAALIGKHRDRLAGGARIDPWQSSAPSSLRQAIELHGFRALMLNPWEEHFRADLDRIDPLLEIVHEHHLPVIVATGYPWLSEALQVCRLAQRWPTIPIVMSNGGQINISGLGQADATLAMQKADNLYIDTAGVYRQDFIEETVNAFGGRRVLFASGSPYFDQRYEIKRVILANLDEKERLVMQGLAARNLLGI
jgi:predicted TIM-barrel fold metal-dependent hydrolase